MASIKLNTGLKIYDIEDENGNIRGQLSFNPSDINFFSRAHKMQENISEMLKELGELSVEDSDDKVVETIDKFDTQMKHELDTLFDCDASAIVFGNQSCLNIYKGKTFIERFLEAFMPIIQADFKKEFRNIEKYTSKKSE